MQYCDTKRKSRLAVWGIFAGLVALFVIGLAALAYKHHSDKNTLFKKISETEKKLEVFFYEGYEKGYQSAIIDAYLESPNYMVLEDGDGRGTLWKKVEIDETNKKRLEGVPEGVVEEIPDPQTEVDDGNVGA